MSEKSERLWVLIGILVGFYGNWYFNLLTKLETIQDEIVLLFWIASAVSLFAYCTEIIHWKKTIIANRVRLGLVLAITHLLTTGVIYIIASLSILQFTGIVLWFLISVNESRMYWSSAQNTGR